MAASERVEFGRIRPQAEALAQERFAFLVRDRGWTLGPIKHGTHDTAIYYVCRPDFGLEVELHTYDGIEVYLRRLRAGKPRSATYLYAKDGTCVRTHLPHFVRRVLAVNDPWLAEMIQRWNHPPMYGMMSSDGYRWADLMFTDLSPLVDRYLDLILAQPMEVLFPPEKRSSY